jgi:hypothetical protein
VRTIFAFMRRRFRPRNVVNPRPQTDPRVLRQAPPAGEVEPFRITYTKAGIEISGLLTDIDSGEEFLATVEMLKQRLPKAARRSDDEAAN